jgi:hypothetical protein
VSLGFRHVGQATGQNQTRAASGSLAEQNGKKRSCTSCPVPLPIKNPSSSSSSESSARNKAFKNALRAPQPPCSLCASSSGGIGRVGVGHVLACVCAGISPGVSTSTPLSLGSILYCILLALHNTRLALIYHITAASVLHSCSGYVGCGNFLHIMLVGCENVV